MAAHEFVAEFARNVVEVEVSVFAFDFGVEQQVHENVADFLAHFFGAFKVDCLEQFGAFLHEMPAYRFVRLLPVPRAAVGRAQAFYDVY